MTMTPQLAIYVDCNSRRTQAYFNQHNSLIVIIAGAPQPLRERAFSTTLKRMGEHTIGIGKVVSCGLLALYSDTGVLIYMSAQIEYMLPNDEVILIQYRSIACRTKLIYCLRHADGTGSVRYGIAESFYCD
jgi:hypothetical protein